ncbi:hypothetical protein KIPB_017137, partial [Kipferlia bialata]
LVKPLGDMMNSRRGTLSREIGIVMELMAQRFGSHFTKCSGGLVDAALTLMGTKVRYIDVFI